MCFSSCLKEDKKPRESNCFHFYSKDPQLHMGLFTSKHTHLFELHCLKQCSSNKQATIFLSNTQGHTENYFPHGNYLVPNMDPFTVFLGYAY